MMIIDTV